ncbi:MAG: DUF1287 domain-containing protein [Actinomycetia bacterium]|nr:DUF1287 domain-containing protein [Actinomycetes bacterium]
MDAEQQQKRFNIKHLLLVILVLIIGLGVVLSIRQLPFDREYEPPTALVNMLPRYRVIDMDDIGIETDADRDGINDQKDIMLGAKKQLEVKAKNILLMPDEPNYYQGGDPPGDLALATDIVDRAFREAGYGLRELVNEDINQNFDQYPLRAIWNQKYSDPDIDYRRIQNLEVFFRRNAEPLTAIFNPAEKDNLQQWLPGDVVFFDMDRDGYTDNVGIVSDSTTRSGATKVIYNYIEPGYTVEKDILGKEKITGHFRYPKPDAF